MAESGRSPWFYVLAGCGVILLLIGIAVAALAFFGWRWAKDFEATMKDPEKRAEQVLTKLDATELPDGWRPGIAMRAPLGLGEFVMLTSGDAVASDEGFDMGDRGFVYLRVPGQEVQQARERFEAGGTLADAFDTPGMNFDVDREIARGTFEVEGGLVLWMSGMGSSQFQGDRLEGLTTVGLLDCDADEKSRFVTWFGGELAGAPDDPTAQVGTFADPTVLRDFLGYFRLCPR